ncbi:tetratricopeptide repeat protein [Thalassovita sp.]|uniref:tetratricopeptide repeat protein n=1 Tax=Thalassovita sp. TaxID=1979401 RepID=UPI003B5A9BE1
MSVKKHNLKRIVAATLLTVTFSLPSQVQAESVPDMLSQLKTADEVEAKRLAKEIALRWGHSGSPAMDLLLKRGTEAAMRGDFEEAIGHLTALTDHAPEFAEGWHQRASTFYRMDRYGPAMHDLERALHLNPNNFQAMFGLGAILEQVGKPKLALEAYSLALTVHPHYEEAKEAIARLGSTVAGPKL